MIPSAFKPILAVSFSLSALLYASDPVTDSATLHELRLSAPRLLEKGWPSTTETESLRTALKEYRSRPLHAEGDDPLETWLAANPSTTFRTWIEASRALDLYRAGLYSDSLAAWEKAWARARSLNFEDPRPEGIVTDIGIRYGELLARLGRRDELAGLLAELAERPVRGASTERLAQIRQALGTMRVQPGRAYQCGPIALANLARKAGKSESAAAILDARSEGRGFTLSELDVLASDHLPDYRPARRVDPESELILPCVVHWKSNHYAAAFAVPGGKVHVVDPTFGIDHVISREAFLAEASGWFMVGTPLSEGWEEVSEADAASVIGRGVYGRQNTDDDSCPKGCGGSEGMPGYGYDPFNATLVISDTPLVLETPYGPETRLTLTYHQAAKFEERARGDGDPNDSGVPFTGFGAKWTHNWCAFVVRDGSEHRLYLPDGRQETHDAYFSQGNLISQPNRMSGAKLSGVSAGAITRTAADGSRLVFNHHDNVAGSDRIYLTEVIDPQGNTTTIQYEVLATGDRIDSVTDDFGRVLEFQYNSPAGSFRPDKVVETATGRFAEFKYENGELSEVTDAEGIKS